MAIKMDGNTITELKLKASDGSEVTKQLTEEGTIPTPTATKQISANGTYDVKSFASAEVNVGGGGNAGEFALLKTVDVETAAHQIDFVWETDWEQYDVFYIVCNATLSASDYLYFGFSPSKTNNCEYLKQSASSFNGVSDFSVFAPVYSRGTNELFRSATGTRVGFAGYASGGTASFFAYTASVNIQTGSTFKIYGAKLPTA